MRAKIKIFLAGYVDYINAQNLNCLALANYLHGILTVVLHNKQTVKIVKFILNQSIWLGIHSEETVILG